jgi:hypothetical protein
MQSSPRRALAEEGSDMESQDVWQKAEESWEAHIFLSVLIHSQMDCTEATSTYLLLDNVLIDAMYGTPIVVAAAVMRSRIERLFHAFGS